MASIGDPEPAAREQDFTSKFRAVKVGESRRGIRLEQIYWTTLGEMAKENGLGLGRYIETVASRYPDAVNITSVLRVNVAAWLQSKYQSTSRFTGLKVVDSLIQACPSPAFALQEDKRIAAYNPAFISYIQARFSRFSTASMAKGLRLSLDVPVAELTEMLNRDYGRPVRMGFVLGLEDQRLRGQLSTVLAPSPEPTIIIGYVASI